MITIKDILKPQFVDLGLDASSPAGAVFAVASMLKQSPDILHWQGFYEALKYNDLEEGCPVLFPHARTQNVARMVMSVGRLAKPLGLTRYVFVVGVPLALTAEYLRIMGAISRILRNRDLEGALRKTTTVPAFIDILASNEVAL